MSPTQDFTPVLIVTAIVVPLASVALSLLSGWFLWWLQRRAELSERNFNRRAELVTAMIPPVLRARDLASEAFAGKLKWNGRKDPLEGTTLTHEQFANLIGPDSGGMIGWFTSGNNYQAELVARASLGEDTRSEAHDVSVFIVANMRLWAEGRKTWPVVRKAIKMAGSGRVEFNVPKGIWDTSRVEEAEEAETMKQRLIDSSLEHGDARPAIVRRLRPLRRSKLPEKRDIRSDH
jgi:hypothetical protein